MILKIKNKQFDFWDEFSVGLVYDSIGSLFSFTGQFDPNFADHKPLFRPLSYPEIQVEHNGQLLLTGTVIKNDFNVEAIPTNTKLQGYSLPGVLQDSEIPVSLYPLQSDTRTLREIADRLVSKFGVQIEVDDIVSGAMDQKFDISVANEGDTVAGYINSLASQRNIVLSHTKEGKLLFTRARTSGDPIARFEEGAPGVKISLSTNGQKMSQEITVQRQDNIKGNNAGEATLQNPFVPVFRSRVKTQSSGDDNATEDAAKSVLAAQLKAIKLTITTDRWEWLDDRNSEVMTPNNIITVISPQNFIFTETRFFVEAVTLSGDREKETAVLTCVIPEVYSRETPKNIFE